MVDIEKDKELSENTEEQLESVDVAPAEIDGANTEPVGSVDTVTLCDDEGNEYQFDLLGYVDYADKLYAVMVPAELYEDDDEDQVVIMETFFEGNEPNFLFVEDEILAQKILDEYTKLDDQSDEV